MGSRLTFCALCIGATLLGSSCSDGKSGHGVEVPELSLKTDVDYALAIDTMRETWRARPREISEENGKAEQRFISRLMSIANRTKGTSNFKATKSLWREVVTEHKRDYPDSK